MIQRPRRLDGKRDTKEDGAGDQVDKSSLVYPVFVREGEHIREEIPTMPGQYRYSLDQLPYKLQSLKKAGVDSVIFFGIPEKKDEVGSGAYAEDGIVQKALEATRKQFGSELYLITDVCMCEYTSHGHCGVLCGHEVDNDPTLSLLAKTALSHARAGADMVAPSDMMDGRVLAIRNELDRPWLYQYPDHVLRRKICLRLLRALPGCSRFRPLLRRPEVLPDGFPQPQGRDKRSSDGCGRRG